jgi:hypothetical protein
MKVESKIRHRDNDLVRETVEASLDRWRDREDPDEGL